MLQQQLLRLLHRFNGFYSRTTWVSWYKKGKTSLDLNEARDNGGWWGQLHQLDHVQTIYTSLQTDKHTNKPHRHHTDTSHQSIFTGQMLLLMPNQQCQSTEGTNCNSYSKVKKPPLWSHSVTLLMGDKIDFVNLMDCWHSMQQLHTELLSWTQWFGLSRV